MKSYQDRHSAAIIQEPTFGEYTMKNYTTLRDFRGPNIVGRKQ